MNEALGNGITLRAQDLRTWGGRTGFEDLRIGSIGRIVRFLPDSVRHEVQGLGGLTCPENL